MNYWRSSGKPSGPYSVGMNWAALKMIAIVGICLIFAYWPLPFSRFAPFGTWQFYVGLGIWTVLIIGAIFAKVRRRAGVSSRVNESKNPSDSDKGSAQARIDERPLRQ